MFFLDEGQLIIASTWIQVAILSVEARYCFPRTASLAVIHGKILFARIHFIHIQLSLGP